VKRDEAPEILAQLVLGLEPIQPLAASRQRLLAAAQGVQRFAPFTRDFAKFFDLEIPNARALLEGLHDENGWRSGKAPGAPKFRTFTAGPGADGLRSSFARLLPGSQIARHRHLTRELIFVLNGAMIDSDGRTYGPGEVLQSEPDSVHSVSIGGSHECWVASLVGNVEIDDA
jgi:hypothetical protein